MKNSLIFMLFVIWNFLIISGQDNFYDKLADSALSLTTQIVKYDPSYIRLDYPNGDVPPDRGVCTDVIIRAYRKLEIDLQKEVHEDMKTYFHKYPNNWGLSHTDRNIDHRRVPNLMTFFIRKGTVLTVSPDPSAYLPGDIVCWDLGGGVPHIGMVVKNKSPDGQRHLIVHNIGAGQVLEDCLFRFKITGHFKYEK